MVAAILSALIAPLHPHAALVHAEGQRRVKAVFLRSGAVINFVPADGRVRFEILLSAAEAITLAISSRLLRVAERVRTVTR